MKYKDEDKYGRIESRPGRLRRRLFVAVVIIGLVLWSGWKYHTTHLPPKELIMSYPPQTSAVTRRYILFTMPIESGEWPSLYSTKDSLNWVGRKGEGVVETQIYSNLPRRVAQIETLPTSDFIMAMATDSTHIMAADFYPKMYLKGTQTTLLLVLGPLDPVETETVRKHLDNFGLRAYVIKVPAVELETRKFELLGSLAEFRKYAQGTAKYYTIIDPDVFIPSISAFQNLVAQYNSVESHLIVDESFKNSKSYTPITVTAAFLDRMFDGDNTWNKCVKATGNSQTTGLEKISKCAAIMQGSNEAKAKFDGESLCAREVKGSALGLLESGHQPLSLRPLNIDGPPHFETDLFQELVSGQGNMNASELLARYSFWENDEVRWVYTHGVSMSHYPKGISDRHLKMTEVTWEREPDETPAHDAPYYRAQASEEQKTAYLLHTSKSYSARTGKDKLDWQSIIYRNEAGKDIQIDWVKSLL